MLLGPGARTADAVIKAYESNEEATYLGEIRRGNCRLTRRPNGDRTFSAGAKTTNRAWDFGVFFSDFRGYGRTYDIRYGGSNPTVDFEEFPSGRDFSNNWPFPGGRPPDSSGQIQFTRGGRKLGIATYPPLPNRDYSQGVILAGTMKCR